MKITGLLMMWAPLSGWSAERPNIIIMLSDNLGYGDLGSYGGGAVRGAPTPEIDRLAEQGLRLTNFNVEAECTPSRSSLRPGACLFGRALPRASRDPGLP